MTDDATLKPGSLEEILYRGSPRAQDIERVAVFVRKGRMSEALPLIREFYRCSASEAETVFYAMENLMVAGPMKFVEIALDEVTPLPYGTTDNPLILVPQFFGRRGHYVEPLVFLKGVGGYKLGERYVRKDEIDQAWKVVAEE